MSSSVTGLIELLAPRRVVPPPFRKRADAEARRSLAFASGEPAKAIECLRLDGSRQCGNRFFGATADQAIVAANGRFRSEPSFPSPRWERLKLVGSRQSWIMISGRCSRRSDLDSLWPLSAGIVVPAADGNRLR